MGIKEFFKSKSKNNILTGAAKVATTATLIGALMVGGATMAYASVPAENVIGDLQYTEDRSTVKAQDAAAIQEFFISYDKYGNPVVSNERIRKAIELSNVLNMHYFSPLYYTNTTKNEVINLDVDGLYSEYQNALSLGDEAYNNFCNKALYYKPAIDAYTLFACGRVSLNLKNQLSERIFDIVTCEYPNITSYPAVYITENEVFVIVDLNGRYEKITLHGSIVDEIKASCISLDKRYNKAVLNVAGISNESDNAFGYNGIDSVSLESVWFSTGDDYRKADLAEGLNASESLADLSSFDITIEDPTSAVGMTSSEKDTLVRLGFNPNLLNNATTRNAYIEEVPKYTLN